MDPKLIAAILELIRMLIEACSPGQPGKGPKP